MNAADKTSTQGQPLGADEQALARYRYLLRTAPPEAIEQAHAEAFGQLTPEQRAQALRELTRELPPSERMAATRTDAQTLARMATRAELRQPGTLERSLGRGGIGPGGMLAGGLLSSIAGSFIGTAIAHQLLGGFPGGSDTDDGDSTATANSQDEYDELDDGEADFGDDFADV